MEDRLHIHNKGIIVVNQDIFKHHVEFVYLHSLISSMESLLKSLDPDDFRFISYNCSSMPSQKEILLCFNCSVELGDNPRNGCT